MTTHQMTSADYLDLVGAAEGPSEVDATTYVRMLGNPMRASDLVPEISRPEPEIETPAKTEFAEWLALEASPFEVLTEHRGIPDRQFRFDWAIAELGLAFEYDGINAKGHASASGVFRDSEKGNLAQLAGWMLIRVNARTLREGSGYEVARRAIELRRERLRR